MRRTQSSLLSLAIALMLGVAGSASAKIYMHAPDGRTIELKGGTPEPDLSAYRSPLDSKVVDSRFYTKQGMYFGNEAYNTGQVGFVEMVKAGFPIAYNTRFDWITHQEAYWYARYILSWVGAQAHMGISMVHGPYWTVKARELYSKNRLLRDRGERVPSNKDVMMGVYLPLFYKRTGYPRAFEFANPSYLDYASGDPRFTGPVVTEDTFDDPQSGKVGNWGVPRYTIDWANLRWSHDRIDTTFDLGAIGQGLKRRSMWIGYMFHSNHVEQSPSDLGSEITLLGNDAEEGFRGISLTFMSFNMILEAKASLFADASGKHLGGINPLQYDPAQGLRYLPHLIKPNIVLVGDLPERLWALDIADPASWLWDQASFLWGTTEYFHWANAYQEIFTPNPPVDGGIIERRTGRVARGMSNVLVQNIEAMHLKNGLLVSRWTPAGGAGDQISMQDAAMALVAFKEYRDRHEEADVDEDRVERVGELISRQADFLLEVQGEDGSFYESYDVTSRQGIGENILSTPQWWGIRALVAAWQATEEDGYLEAARRTYNLLNRKYWDEGSGLYRTRLGDDTVILTPLSVGATLGALRELMFATPLQFLKPQIERYTRWWVQTVDGSGFIQAEDNKTGELAYGTESKDQDHDGIPFLSGGSGRFGCAPVPAGKVAVNIGGADNPALESLAGAPFEANRYAEIEYGYVPQSQTQQRSVLLPIRIPEEGLVERESLERFDGTIIPLPASKPVERGTGIARNLSGRQIFEANCAPCHGVDGEGITGKNLRSMARKRPVEIKKVPMNGRFNKLMPPWGNGVDELAGVLTEEEIDRVVEYIKTGLFGPGGVAEGR